MEVYRPMSTTLHILVDHHNVVGWRLVIIYMRTPSTHYYLESSGQATYKGTYPLTLNLQDGEECP
jgi:hypothetical protein